MEPREALNRSCQVARYFQSKGYKKGDAVALGKHKTFSGKNEQKKKILVQMY